MTKLEMLKYPIMMITILVGLVLAKWLLDIDVSRITKIGPQGVEIDPIREDASVAVSEVATKLNELSARMDTLRAEIARMDALRAEIARMDALPLLTKIDTLFLRAEFEEVSDAVSQLSKSQSKSTKTVLVGRQGYIFIGIYDTTDVEWKRAILHRQDSNKPITSAPNELPVDERFLIGTNIVLRDDLPLNDEQYFRRRKNIGVIPLGTHVTLLDKPEKFERNHGAEYWAKVKVSE